MIRKLVARINESLSEKLVSSRRRLTAPIKIWVEPLINSEANRERAKRSCILGETVDLSRTGLAFLVSSIRLQEIYLVGQDRTLNIEIDLPNGKVHMQAVGRRYEKVGVHLSTERFLVGAHITKIDSSDEETYNYFLKHRRKIRKGSQTLELGVD